MTGEELNAAIQHHVIPIDGHVHLHLHGQISVEGKVSSYVRTAPEPSPVGITMTTAGEHAARTLFIPRSSILAIETVVVAE